MNLSKTKSITLIDLFSFYPFKKNIETKDNVIPIPYIKKEDIVYNEKTIDYIVYRKVIDRYLELLVDYLKEGNKFKLPNKLGFIQIQRFKVKHFLDKVASKNQQKKVYKKSNGNENYMFFIKWMRNYKEAIFNYKWHWRLTPNRKLLRSLYQAAEKDYTFINKFMIGK